MNLETLRQYCLTKEGASEDMPFDDNILCFRVLNKIFALTDFTSNPTSVNLKCDPEKVILLREQYNCVIPGYHMNKKHWNTVILDDSVTDTLVQRWIDDSYILVVKTLSKSQKQNL
ncbi:MAG: MmcQ/YjbR family DNA-binding protein [Verrucomicrobia bacterium]|nr:MmcQ/YjbR family DNA-binding protein [Cytophagales bacterium]